MDNGASSYRRFLSGDETAMKEIIDGYYDGLVLYLNNYLNNLYDAEDMALETLITLGVKKPHFQEKSSFRTWLYAIGRNEALGYLRRHSREVPAPIDEFGQLSAEMQDMEINYILDDERKQLHRAMMHLKTEYRQVLWLKYFEEMSAQEISIVMKKTVYSVNHLLKRAKESLKEQLEREGFEYEES